MQGFFRRVTAGIALAAVVPLGAAAQPINERITASSSSGFYLFVDGSYQSINLPDYELGWRRVSGGGGPNFTAELFEPRVTGYGISGGFGFRWPSASAFRIELGGSYVDADSTQSAAHTTGATTYGLVFVNGRNGDNFICAVCTLASNLSSNMEAWNLYLKAINDARFGATTFSTSLSGFGGRAEVNQTLVQNVLLAGASFDTYTVNSSVKWTDWGAKLGLQASTDIAEWLAIGLGGSIGVARRSASMSASDTDTGIGFNGASSASANRDATPLLANAEVSSTIRYMRDASVRAFAGLNFDSRVPGIAAPGFSGTPAGVATVGTPADILFQSRTSYYVGGALRVGLAP